MLSEYGDLNRHAAPRCIANYLRCYRIQNTYSMHIYQPRLSNQGWPESSHKQCQLSARTSCGTPAETRTKPHPVLRCLQNTMDWYADAPCNERGNTGMRMPLVVRMAIGHAHFEAIIASHRESIDTQQSIQSLPSNWASRGPFPYS